MKKETKEVVMEVDPERHEVWFRLSSGWAFVPCTRELLVPGVRVFISGVVSKYESSGGYKDFEGDIVPMSDRIQLSTGTMALQIDSEQDEKS